MASRRNRPNRFRQGGGNQQRRPTSSSGDRRRLNFRTRFREQVRSQGRGRPIDNEIPDSADDDATAGGDDANAAAVKFITPTRPPAHNGRDCSNPFKCPPKTFAGGRRPRVKSNIKARKRNYWNPRKKSRLIKRRKQVNPSSRRRINQIRQGRAQSLNNNNKDKNNNDIITNDIDDKPVKAVGPVDPSSSSDDDPVTPDPLKKLLKLVEEKEEREKARVLFAFNPRPQFQNKRLHAKHRNNAQNKNSAKKNQFRSVNRYVLRSISISHPL